MDPRAYAHVCKDTTRVLSLGLYEEGGGSGKEWPGIPVSKKSEGQRQKRGSETEKRAVSETTGSARVLNERRRTLLDSGMKNAAPRDL